MSWTQKIPYAESQYLSWFVPQNLGDTVCVHEWSADNLKNTQTIWFKMDSTEVFVRDILD